LRHRRQQPRSSKRKQLPRESPRLSQGTPLAHSLTIYHAASSTKTLGIMLTIAILGVPIVLAYTASSYWIFRGKVKLERTSY
jgi:cytochrome bd ubiquinol oxidase subunit II